MKIPLLLSMVLWLTLGLGQTAERRTELATQPTPLMHFEKALGLARHFIFEREAANIREELGMIVQKTLLEEARLLVSKGMKVEAIAVLTEVIEASKSVPTERSLVITAQDLLEEIYLDLGEWDKAIAFYHQSLRAAKVEGQLSKVATLSDKLERVRRKREQLHLYTELILQRGHVGSIAALDYSPDGQTLASGGGDQQIILWNVMAGVEVRSLQGHKGVVSAVTFAPDGRKLASGSWDKTTKLWDVAKAREVRTFRGHTAEVTAIEFAPDGQTLASASNDHTIKLWDVATGAELGSLDKHKGSVVSLKYAPDGRMLASVSVDETIKLWDVKTRKLLHTLRESSVSTLAFAPDGRTLASGSLLGTIKLWKLATGVALRSWQVGGSFSSIAIGSLAYAPDGRTLAAGGSFGGIMFWDVKTGSELRRLDEHDASIESLAYAPDGRTLATGDFHSTIKLWDVSSGAKVTTLLGHSDWLTTQAIAPDGRRFASCRGDKSVHLWELATEAGLIVLKGHTDWASSLVFAPNGRALASGNDGGEVKLWDLEARAELPMSSTLPNWVQLKRGYFDLQTINGKKLLFATVHAQVNIINYDTGERLCSLIALDENDWAVVTPDGLFDASPGATKLMHFVISGLEEGYAVVAFEQMQERYYQPGLLAKLLGFDKTPIKQVPPFTGEKLYPKVEYRWQQAGSSKLEIKLNNRGGGIGEVAVLVNGNTWLKDVRPAGFDSNAREASFVIDLKDAPFLVGAPDQVEVVARNAEGWLTSARSSRLVYAEETEAAKPVPELWAIIGGTSDYAGTQLDLNFAAKDAEDFANALKLGGYRLFGAERVHLQVLTTNNQDARLLPTKENFRRVFAEFQRAKPNDVLLVYLSGHGVAFRQDGDRVLYSYLTQTATSGDLKDSDVRQRDAITSDELMDWIRAIKTNKNVLLFDTCAAGAFADNLNLAVKKDDAGEYADNQKRALSQLRQRTAFHILMGSAANKPSYETSQFNQGLLTRALLEGMQYGAVNNERVVNVNELFQFARRRVEELADSIGNRWIQTPQLSSPEGDNLPLLLMTKEDAAAIRLEQARPFVMRPRLVNRDNRRDFEIEKRLIQQLRAANQPGPRGATGRTAPLVYLEDVELPIAITPNGEYRYEGDQIIVNLDMLRGEQVVGTLTVSGKRDDLSALSEKIIADLVAAMDKLPKPVSERPK